LKYWENNKNSILDQEQKFLRLVVNHSITYPIIKAHFESQSHNLDILQIECTLWFIMTILKEIYITTPCPFARIIGNGLAIKTSNQVGNKDINRIKADQAEKI